MTLSIRITFLSILFVCWKTGDAAISPPYVFNFSYESFPVKMFEGDQRIISFNLSYSSVVKLRVDASIDYGKVAHITNMSLPAFLTPTTFEDIGETSGFITLRGSRLGSAYVIFNITTFDDGRDVVKEMLHYRGEISNPTVDVKREYDEPDPLGLEVIVLRRRRVIDMVFRVITMLLVVLITFLMGCELETKIIASYLKKPFAPAIGFTSQYLVMPLIALALGQIMSLPPAFGFGLITIGCSPGGGGSNMWTILLGGELNLSMTMTFFSSISALGMMPMWIFLTARFYIDTSKVKIPYGNIALNILQVVVPVFIGILVKKIRPNAAKKLTRLTRPCALLFIIHVLSFGTYVNLYIYKLIGDYPILLPTGAVLPWLGFLFGYILGRICRQSHKLALTIALETGIQNIGIAILILLFSMPQPDGDMGAVMPIVVAVFTPLPLYLILIGLNIRRRCCKKEEEKDDIGVDSNTPGFADEDFGMVPLPSDGEDSDNNEKEKA